MSKLTMSTLLYTFTAAGWLLTACDSNEKSDKEKLATQQQEIQKEADQANNKIEQAEVPVDISDSLEDLSKFIEEISIAKKDYLYAFQERQQKLNERISELDTKLTDPNQVNQSQWVSNRRVLIAERDKVRANMMELQKPMTKERWTMAEREIKELLAAIDKQLKESDLQNGN